MACRRRTSVVVMTIARKQLGSTGERIAARWYESEGYDVVAMNWRVAEGEIDVIARREEVLVFCEVKTRNGNRFGTGLDAVTVEKQRQVRMLAYHWLRLHPMFGVATVRFDVVAIDVSTRPIAVQVVPDAF